MKQFCCQTRILYGEGSLDQLKSRQCSRVLLICDPFFHNNGLDRKLLKDMPLEASQVFSDFTTDPDITQVAQAVAVAQSLQPDTVIALGGGSAIDLAKAVVWVLPQPAQLIAVPTTSGSGSEVTDFAVLTHNGVKYPLIDPKLRPHMAVLDPQLLRQLPQALVAASGFDVLAHALESWVATQSSPITDALAQEAFCTALKLLLPSSRGDLSARGPVHMASCMAGMAFSQSGLGLCHALSHSLGALLHLPHGTLNAILLPEVVRFNARQSAAKYSRLSRLAGLGGSVDSVALRNLISALTRLREQLQLPDSLRCAGISASLVNQILPQAAEAALADPCCRTNPVQVSRQDALNILRAVSGYGG